MSGYGCPRCRRFFRVRKVGVFWEEGMPKTNDLAGEWVPYKLWAGDLLECEGCGAQLIIPPPARQPIAEHYQPNYSTLVERYGPIVRIDDCAGGPFNEERAHELRRASAIAGAIEAVREGLPAIPGENALCHVGFEGGASRCSYCTTVRSAHAALDGLAGRIADHR